MEADAVCLRLMERLDSNRMEAQVHSVFENTLNLSIKMGLVALLNGGAAIQPMSIRICGMRPPALFSLGEALKIDRSGVFSPKGDLLLSLNDACRIDLSIKPRPVDVGGYGDLIRAFLQKREDVCLAPLIEGEQNAYTLLLEPRFKALRYAILNGDTSAAYLAANCAGCGMGLTPSSDDLLAGYLATLYALGRIPLEGLNELCIAAAAHTNEISASILSRLGEGLISEHLLILFNKICGGISIADAIKAVASIGSTSGGDILTGVYFGLLDYETGR